MHRYPLSILQYPLIINSPADEESYQKHPIHDDFRKNYASLWEKVVIYDAIGPKR